MHVLHVVQLSECWLFSFSCCVPRSQSQSREPLKSTRQHKWRGFGCFANIPDSELEKIDREYSSEKKKKQAVIHYLTSTHPAPSWTLVAHALYWTAWDLDDESFLRALDRLQQLFPIGNALHVCTCMYYM